jgi:hypothetical protein
VEYVIIALVDIGTGDEFAYFYRKAIIDWMTSIVERKLSNPLLSNGLRIRNNS